MTRKVGLVFLGLAILFTVIAAVIVGRRMSDQAGAILIGVLCGVAASVPTTLLMSLALTGGRRWGGEDRGRVIEPAAAQAPTVIVLQLTNSEGLSWPAAGRRGVVIPQQLER